MFTGVRCCDFDCRFLSSSSRAYSFFLRKGEAILNRTTARCSLADMAPAHCCRESYIICIDDAAGRFPWARAELSDATYSLYTQGRHRGSESARWGALPTRVREALYRMLAVDSRRRPTALECLMLFEDIEASPS
jgi:hypothetical protein